MTSSWHQSNRCMTLAHTYGPFSPCIGTAHVHFQSATTQLKDRITEYSVVAS